MYTTIVSFFQQGGVFMYPIVIVLGLGIAIAVERWLYLTKARVTNQKVWKQLAPLVADGKYNEAQEIARKSASAMGNVLSYGLNRIRSARRRDDIEKAMEESMINARSLPRYSPSRVSTCSCRSATASTMYVRSSSIPYKRSEACSCTRRLSPIPVSMQRVLQVYPSMWWTMTAPRTVKRTSFSGTRPS